MEYAISNYVSVLSEEAEEIMSNGEQGDAKTALLAAPTVAGGHTAFYLRTNGDPVGIAVYNEKTNECFWGAQAFGDMSSVEDILTILTEIANWDSFFDFPTKPKAEFFWQVLVRQFAELNS